MKLQRLIAILTVLLQRERISATALAEKFGVSVRTIYRDMETLEQAGIPITVQTGAQGGFAIVDQYKIDKKLFTHQDITMLLTSLYSVSGPLEEAKVNQTLEKIKGLIPQGYGSAIELTSKQLYIDMTPWSANPSLRETMALIQQGLEESRLLRFDYTAREGKPLSRLVEPHQLVLKENQWYLRAWCRERAAFRTFKLARIRQPELLPETFSPREFNSNLDDFKDWTNPRMIYVDLLIEPNLRERVLDYCREEYLSEREDGKIAIHMPFVESETGYGVLLEMGHECEVIGPPQVRAELIRRIGLLQQVYTGEQASPQ